MYFPPRRGLMEPLPIHWPFRSQASVHSIGHYCCFLCGCALAKSLCLGGSLCCFSPDCACIRCSNCRASLTTVPPKRRFQCMECEVLPPESSFDSRPEYCEHCFSLPDVLHWHKYFLLVDEKGVHQAVERLCGLAEIHYIQQDDFPLKEGLGEDETCGICCIDFSAENPATCNVGCTKGHGEGVADGHRGVVDSGMFYHADCRMSWIRAQKTDTYCAELPLACKVCFLVTRFKVPISKLC